MITPCVLNFLMVCLVNLNLQKASFMREKIKLAPTAISVTLSKFISLKKYKSGVSTGCMVRKAAACGLTRLSVALCYKLYE